MDGNFGGHIPRRSIEKTRTKKFNFKWIMVCVYNLSRKDSFFLQNETVSIAYAGNDVLMQQIKDGKTRQEVFGKKAGNRILD
jgi:hypothetical protein